MCIGYDFSMVLLKNGTVKRLQHLYRGTWGDVEQDCSGVFWKQFKKNCLGFFLIWLCRIESGWAIGSASIILSFYFDH